MKLFLESTYTYNHIISIQIFIPAFQFDLYH